MSTATAVKEQPILMSGPMVRAIRSGLKTQTRRLVKPQPAAAVADLYCGDIVAHDMEDEETGASLGYGFQDDWNKVWRCPYGKPGDRLWVRESTHRRPMLHLLTGEPLAPEFDGGAYTADCEPVLCPKGFDYKWWYSRKSCPSIHMPRWASRILLEITDVRVERLQDISEADARSEGCRKEDWEYDDGECCDTAREAFSCLWESINSPDSWAANPWVWVVEFRVLEGLA